MFTVPRERQANLEFRQQLLARCEHDPELRSAVRTYALRDVIFWFDVFAWTYDPRVPPFHLPFVLFDYEREILVPEFCAAIEEGYDLYAEKSRDTGVTEVGPSGVTLHYWLQDSGGNDFLIGSRKEDLVDSRGVPDTIFEKLRYKLYHLPKWMIPTGFRRDKHDLHCKLINPATGSVIVGEANNKHFGTGARKKCVWYDEFPKWESTDSDAWTSCGDVTKCRIAVGTPFGMSNKAAELRHSGQIKVIRVHALQRPDRDMDWYREQKKRRTEQELAQEIDISYEGSAGKRFFPNYNLSLHRRELVANPDLDVLMCWDFGYHHPAVLFTQKDTFDRWLWLHCIVGKNVLIDHFARYVQRMMAKWFPEHRAEQFTHVGDPAGGSVNDKIDETTIMMLAKVGIYVVTQRSPRVTRAKLMKLLLDQNVNGLPTLMVSAEEDDRYDKKKPEFLLTQSMWHVHEGFLGGVRYDDRGEKEDYKKDGTFDHIFDAAGYGAYYLYPAGLLDFDDARSDGLIERNREGQVTRRRKVKTVDLDAEIRAAHSGGNVRFGYGAARVGRRRVY